MKRIKVVDLPEFDTAPYLGSEAAIAAYLRRTIRPCWFLRWATSPTLAA